MITLDGATLEGGGQLVRVALALSTIRCIPIRVENIRAGRAGRNAVGGLKESHLAALNWLADACRAKVSDVAVGSQSFTFRPSLRRVQTLVNLPVQSTIELKKPGSVWLILQAILPFIVFSTDMPVLELTIKGGTNVSSSMSGEYVQQVLLPTLERIGLPQIKVTVPRRGWGDGIDGVGEARIRVSRPSVPDAAAMIPLGARLNANANAHATTKDASISPQNPSTQTTSSVLPGSFSDKIPGFTLAERGDIIGLSVTILAHSRSFADVIFSAIARTLAASALLDNPLPIPTLDFEQSGSSARTYVLIVAHTSEGYRLGRDVLYGRKVKNVSAEAALAETIANDVVKQIMREMRRGSCVDEYMEDQLVIWQALATSESRVDSGSGHEANSEGSSIQSAPQLPGKSDKKHNPKQRKAGAKRKAKAGNSDERDMSEEMANLDISGQEDSNDSNHDHGGSLHTRTVRWVCEQMLGDAGVKFSPGGFCTGVGSGETIEDD
jgi:RNA 3'-terminal phosphate cyclase (ATP)